METTRGEAVLGPIRLLFEVGTVAGMSDGQLLDRFLARRADEEAAEVAFAALVERHGPMVLRACRGRLGDEHDAQDAFQATFLILARKAATIRDHDSAASWLRGVALRVASCARRAAALRRAKERKAAGGKADHVAGPDRSDLVPAILEEVGDLPEPDRTPLMLCLLDGLTHEEAATRLGWPVGTVKTRVRRAKDRLRARLTRRGLAPSLGAVAAALATREASAMPATLVRATARAALSFELGRGTALLSASVAKLVELGMGSLIMTRLKIAGLVIASVGALAAGAATGLARQDSKTQEKPAEPRPEVKAVDPAKPIAAEVADEDDLDRAAEDGKSDILDQVDLARIDIEVHRRNVERLRGVLVQAVEGIESSEASLKALRMVKDLDTFRNSYDGSVKTVEDFDLAKKRIEDRTSGDVEKFKKRLNQNRAKYAEMMHDLRREEQRLKDLEARAARVDPAGPTPGTSGPGEGDGPSVDDRIDRWKLANIGADFLRMDVDRCRDRMKAAHRNLLDVRNRAQRFSRPKEMAEAEYDQAERRLDQEQDFAKRDLVNAQASFQESSRELVRKERQLRDLAKGLPATFQAEFFRSIVDPNRLEEAKPTADVDRRLSDVERKLDLILKALEKPGREPAKK